MIDYAGYLDRARESEYSEYDRKESFISQHMDDEDQIMGWLQYAVDDYDAALPIVAEIRKNPVLMDLASKFIARKLEKSLNEFSTPKDSKEYV